MFRTSIETCSLHNYTGTTPCPECFVMRANAFSAKKVELVREDLWIPVGKKPKGEVLAIGYQNEMLVGHMNLDVNKDWFCESDDVILTEVTAYIPLKSLLAIYKRK